LRLCAPAVWRRYRPSTWGALSFASTEYAFGTVFCPALAEAICGRCATLSLDPSLLLRAVAAEAATAQMKSSPITAEGEILREFEGTSSSLATRSFNLPLLAARTRTGIAFEIFSEVNAST